MIFVFVFFLCVSVAFAFRLAAVAIARNALFGRLTHAKLRKLSSVENIHVRYKPCAEFGNGETARQRNASIFLATRIRFLICARKRDVTFFCSIRFAIVAVCRRRRFAMLLFITHRPITL